MQIRRVFASGINIYTVPVAGSCEVFIALHKDVVGTGAAEREELLFFGRQDKRKRLLKLQKISHQIIENVKISKSLN